MVKLSKELLQLEGFPELSKAQRDALPNINANIDLLTKRTGDKYDIELDEFYIVVNESDIKEERIVFATNSILELEEYLISVNRILSKTLYNIINIVKNGDFK
jgi:hypothetical protein